MVCMLVGDKNSINIPHRELQLLKSRFRPFSTDPDIHQNMCGIRAYINTITAASAGNAAKSHILILLPVYFDCIAIMDRLHILGRSSIQLCYDRLSFLHGPVKIDLIKYIYINITVLSRKLHRLSVYKHYNSRCFILIICSVFPDITLAL